MITSEVQRTLVKSPPELWSELSNPESLARHLGELGEIKITRTEPENLVEWEAEGTTGKVEISPSGWGTRVTLKVSRELPADASGAAGETPEPEASATADAPATSALGDAPGEDTDEAEIDEAEIDAGPPAPTTAPALQAPDPAEEARDPEPSDVSTEEPHAGLTGEPDRKPGPATEAARRAAGWPSVSIPAGPAIESDLRAAESLDGPPAEPQGLEAWAVQSVEANEEIYLGEPHAEPDPEPEPPKRGFFARLFAWRRDRVAGEEPLAAVAGEEIEAEELNLEELDAEAPEAEVLAETSDAAPYDPADGPTFALADAGDAAEAAALLDEPAELSPDELDIDGAAEESETEPGASDLGAALQALGEPEPELLDAEGHDAEARPGEPIAHAPSDTTSEADAELTALDDTGPAAASVETPHDSPLQASAPEGDDPAPAPDLAAELRAAEDVAAEEVEAVLTAVLDRLGAAHHRPFSRP